MAFTLLKGIAEFPREAMTNPYFWRGNDVNQESLIQAMNVAGDLLVEDYSGWKASQRAQHELDLIKNMEHVSGDAEAKCRALWALITTGNAEGMGALIDSDTRRLP